MNQIKFDNRFHEVVYKLNRMFGKVEEILAMITLWGTIIVITIFILARFVFHVPTAWADETARYLLILLGWLGASYAASNNDHLNIDLIGGIVEKHSKNPDFVMAAIDRVAQILSLVFLGLFAVFYSQFVFKMFKLGTPSSSMPLPLWVPMSLVLIGVFLVTVHTICHIIMPRKYWYMEKEMKQKEKEAEEGNELC